MLSNYFIEHLENTSLETFGRAFKITDVRRVFGGSINDCFELKTTGNSYFLKVNSAVTYPDMFEVEAEGLKLLGINSELKVPVPLCVGQFEGNAFFMMEFMESGQHSQDFWQKFGRAMANMHRHTAEKFGLKHNNYIGSLPQSNSKQTSWVEFFIQERLEVQLKRARDHGKIPDNIMLMMERLLYKLDNLFPIEPPSLLHGDLWSGNFSCGLDGDACIFDPAAYYGHREMDIGMSKLFGGFAPEFYAAYNQEWPLESDWERRVDIANLYPLLVHVNLFGGVYLPQVHDILKAFT